MFEWFTLDEAANAIAEATNSPVSTRELLRMAFDGKLKMCAVIPGWGFLGTEEVTYYRGPEYLKDGTPVPQKQADRMLSFTDGIFRHLERIDFQMLRNHGRVAMAGRVIDMVDSEGNRTQWVLGPDTPTFTLADLRISSAEVARLLADASGTTSLEREATEAEEAAPARPRRGRRPSDATDLLKKILDALESYAKATMKDFDRKAMPGPLGESADDEGSFHWLCACLFPSTFKRAKTTFRKQRTDICAVKMYAKRADFYRLALPHIAPKLGVSLNVPQVPKRTIKIT